MAMNKVIRRITDTKQQRAEAYRYWQDLSVGERLSAVWDATVTAYAFKGNNIVDSTTGFLYSLVHGEQGHDRTEEFAGSNRLLLES